MKSSFTKGLLGPVIDRRKLLKASATGIAMLGAPMLISPALAAGGLVALVHTQAAGDNGPVDSMISKLKQLSKEQGFEVRTIYAQDPATYETIYRTLGDAGAAVVVSTFNEVTEPFKAVAPTYPDTKFIQLYGDPMDPPIPNVVTVAYDYYLGEYLSGVFAGHLSKTGKVGYIGGISIPPLNAGFNALKAGVLSVRPDATVTPAFAGSFQDPAKGQEIATQMFGDGIDYIQAEGAATDGGVIAAANEVEGRMVSALDPAQYQLGPSSVIAIVGLDFGTSLYNEVTKALGSDWAGGTHGPTGLGTGVIDFLLSPVYQEKGPEDIVTKSKEVWPEIQTIRAAILDGSLKVPFNTEL